MIFPKVKIFTLRFIIFFTALAMTLLLCELIAFLLIRAGISLPEKDSAPQVTNVSPGKFTMEIPAPVPESIFPPKSVPEKDTAAHFPNTHVNSSIKDIVLPKFNFEEHLTKTHSSLGTTIYSILLKLDKYGRRDTNQASNTFDRHFVLMGCSFAFGEAVDASETLSAHWQKKLPNYKTYNLSFSGYSPNAVLARSLSYHFMDDIQPSKGVAVYLYTDNQIKRSQSAMSVIGNWGPTTAIVKEISDYKFKHAGSYSSARPFYTWFLKMLWHTHFVQFFKIDWPLFVSTNDYDVMARELKAIELLYKQKTSGDNIFVVAIYPENHISTDKEKLKRALENHHILFVDYSNYPIDLRIPEISGVLYDGHPNSAAYSHIANLLIRDLQNYLK